MGCFSKSNAFDEVVISPAKLKTSNPLLYVHYHSHQQARYYPIAKIYTLSQPADSNIIFRMITFYSIETRRRSGLFLDGVQERATLPWLSRPSNLPNDPELQHGRSSLCLVPN